MISKRTFISRKMLLPLFITLVFIYSVRQLYTFLELDRNYSRSFEVIQQKDQSVIINAIEYLPYESVKMAVALKNMKIRGLSPAAIHFYVSNITSKHLKCPFSSQLLTLDKINDDYCDCENSGFDEPGTNACSRSKQVILFLFELFF